jgi:hypothetical protein
MKTTFRTSSSGVQQLRHVHLQEFSDQVGEEGVAVPLETYNLFNHAEASAVNHTGRFDPTGAQVSAAFGTVTATRPERRMQASLRFNF